MTWFENWVDSNFSSDLPSPILYPSIDYNGGIQAEWTIGNFEISLNVNTETCDAYWYALNVSTDDDSEHQLNMAKPDDCKWIVDQIRAMKAGAI